MAKIESLLICVPTTGGIMKSMTAVSITKLAMVLTGQGINCGVLNINNSDIVTVRNKYANMVLESDKWDALLFVDSDMSFAPSAILKMIKLNMPVASVACTRRGIDLRKFGDRMKEHGDFDLAQAESVNFNVLLDWDNKNPKKIMRKGAFHTVAAVGMALTLIQKSALQDLVSGKAARERTDVYDGVVKKSWAFFDHLVYQGITLTEDYAFCFRWTNLLGRDLWVSFSEEIDHIGDFHYRGKYDLVFSKLVDPDDANIQISL